MATFDKYSKPENIMMGSYDHKDRLRDFVTYFVTEVEATLNFHYDILEGNLKKAGEVPEVLEMALGLCTAKLIGSSKVAKVFRKPLDLTFEKIQKNKSLEYHEMIYSFKNSKNDGRYLFVSIAIDIFKSFEYQFIGITSQRGSQKAMKRLAKDAAQRFMNSFKSTEDESLDENGLIKTLQKNWNMIKSTFSPSVGDHKPDFKLNARKIIEGKSKSHAIAGVSIPHKIENPGYEIQFICRESHKECKKTNDEWNTAKLYDKVGVAVKNRDANDYDVFVKEKSKCEKYGYRRSFSDENVDELLIKEYKLAEKCEKTCLHPKYLEEDKFYEKQHWVILTKINEDDGIAVQRRIVNLTENMVDDLEQLKEEVKNQHDETKKQQAMAVQLIKEQLSNILNEHKKILESMTKEFQLAQEDRNNKAAVNRELHTETKGKVIEVIEKLDNLEDKIVQKNKKPPIIFRLNKPVKSFEGRKLELNSIHKALISGQKTVISQAVSIVGLGGIGKTELSKKYAEDYVEYYNNTVFINAEKQETILESFEMLANRLGIKLEKDESEKRLIKYVVEDIYSYFNENGNTLFIFDNVEEYKDIKNFIFNGVSVNNFIHTLITSRCQNWDVGEKGDIELIRLEGFSEDEAMNFLENSLKDENKEDLRALMELLQRFPLALKQAVGYIRQQNNRKRKIKNFTVNDYLTLYTEETRKLLDEGHHITDDVYNQTVKTTWNITLKKIEENEDCGKLAITIFNIMSYLAPDNVDIEKLFTILEKDQNLLWNAVELLQMYSMITLDNRIVNIHRLVQQVTRISLKEKNEEDVVLRGALKLIENTILDAHAVCVWEYASNYSELMKDFYSAYLDRNPFMIKITPIHLLATYRNDPVAIDNIFKHMENNNIINDTFRYSLYPSPLIDAVKNDNLNIVKYLVSRGDKLNLRLYANKTLLHLAAENGHAEIAQYIIGQNDKLAKHKGDDKRIPVDEAIENGHTSVIEVLVPRNNVSQLFHAHFTNAVKSTDFGECIRLINNAKESNRYLLSSKFNGQSLFHIAAAKCDIKVIECLINCKIRINQRDCNGTTPLHRALVFATVEVVALLLDNKADLRMSDKNGLSALHFAVWNESIDVIKLILEKGCSLNERDKNGDTPLNQLARAGRVEVMKLLLEWGADPSITNNIGNTPLIQAAENFQPDEMQLLINNIGSVDVNMTNLNGHTALSRAAYFHQKSDVIQLLLKHGADPTIIDKKGSRAIYFIIQFYTDEEFNLILQNGVDLNIQDARSQDTLLHYSLRALDGDIRVFKLLLDTDIDLNVTNADGETPILYAVKTYNFKAAKMLLERGADPKIADKNGDTVLFRAAQCHAVEVFELSLKHGADPKIRNNKGETILHSAACSGNLQILGLILDQDVDIHVIDNRGDTPLFFAAFSGSLEAMLLLLSRGVDPKVVNIVGQTFIQYAAFKCSIETLKFIFKIGFDVSAVDRNGKSLLHYAAMKGNSQGVEFFTDAGIDANVTDKQMHTPLHDLISIDSAMELKAGEVLIRKGANPNAVNNFGCTPLHFAAQENFYHLANFLLKNGAEINVCNDYGESALHTAISNQHSEFLLQLLLKKGADVNSFDFHGRSPLYNVMCKYQYLSTLLMFLIFGADPNKLNKAGYTVLHLAAEIKLSHKIDDIFQIVQHSVDVNARDNCEKTALHLAAARGEVDIVEFLIHVGADVNAEDQSGNTPLDTATELKHTKVVKYLKRYIAKKK